MRTLHSRILTSAAIAVLVVAIVAFVQGMLPREEPRPALVPPADVPAAPTEEAPPALEDATAEFSQEDTTTAITTDLNTIELPPIDGAFDGIEAELQAL